GVRGGVLSQAAADLRSAGAAERALDGRDRAGRDPGGSALGGSETEDDVTDAGVGLGPAERRGAGRLDADDGEVAVTVDTEDLAAGRAAVPERDGHLVAAEVMGVRQDAAVGDDH